MKNSLSVLTNVYNELKTLLIKQSMQIGVLQEIPYGIQFSISQFTNNGMLRIYLNKKGVIKIDYSQLNQGPFRKRIESIISDYQLKLNGAKEDKSINNTAMIDLKYEPIVGIDESGKGDYFGPLVTAAVYVDSKNKVL
ncbi:MAG: hypothetical protein AB1695_14415, partial [Stygiobacter sp.]